MARRQKTAIRRRVKAAVLFRWFTLFLLMVPVCGAIAIAVALSPEKEVPEPEVLPVEEQIKIVNPENWRPFHGRAGTDLDYLSNEFPTPTMEEVAHPKAL